MLLHITNSDLATVKYHMHYPMFIACTGAAVTSLPHICIHFEPGYVAGPFILQNFFGLFPNVVRTSEIARLLITMYYFRYNSKIFVSSACDRVFVPFFEHGWHKIFWVFFLVTLSKEHALAQDVHQAIFPHENGLCCSQWGLVPSGVPVGSCSSLASLVPSEV